MFIIIYQWVHILEDSSDTIAMAMQRKKTHHDVVSPIKNSAKNKNKVWILRKQNLQKSS